MGVVYPNQFPHLYPILAGPGALYPAEANVRPVWTGGSVLTAPAAKAADQAALPPVITSTQTSTSWDEKWYPSGPRALASLARETGWDVRMSFSRGYVPGAKEEVFHLRDIIGVWVDGHGRRAGAFWERNPEAQFSARKLDAGVKDGEVPSGMAWSTAGTLIYMGKSRAFPYANLTDFKEWVSLRGKVLPSWYEFIQSWVLAHEENARRKANASPAYRKERDHA
jgi:hypothetical protein